jgi:GNAT superfamily N-acetyltransferase
VFRVCTGVEQAAIVHWSDMLAVRPDGRNLGLGRKLKEFQRDMVRSMGGEVIYWTFDPLVARNAHINLNRSACASPNTRRTCTASRERAARRAGDGSPGRRLVDRDGDTASRIAEAAAGARVVGLPRGADRERRVDSRRRRRVDSCRTAFASPSRATVRRCSSRIRTRAAMENVGAGMRSVGLEHGYTIDAS